MNFALTDEQLLLREAARGALSRHKTIEAARNALEDTGALPDLWPLAVEAGWPGLLIDEQHGGAGLEAFDALLVAEELGRVLAAVPLLGLLPATAILNAAADESLPAVAEVEVSARDARLTALPRAGATILAIVSDLATRQGLKLKELHLESGRLDEVFRTMTA